MDEKQNEYFKKFLTELLDGLLRRAGDTVNDMTDPSDAHFPDPSDRATLETDRNFELRIRDREHKLIKKIKKALERIEEGTFGICEECGEKISSQRLEARPVTTLCIDCKIKQETMERSFGI